jgi:Uncharacterised protein family (UPF0160)
MISFFDAQLTLPRKSQFEKASILTGGEFTDKLRYYANAWLPARDILVTAITASKRHTDATGKIIVFEQSIPWKVNSISIHPTVY